MKTTDEITMVAGFSSIVSVYRLCSSVTQGYYCLVYLLYKEYSVIICMVILAIAVHMRVVLVMTEKRK